MILPKARTNYYAIANVFTHIFKSSMQRNVPEFWLKSLIWFLIFINLIFFLSNYIRIEPICHVNISHKMTQWIIRWLILRQMSLFFFFFFSISRLSFTWLQIIRLTDCSNWFVNYVFFPSLSLVISTERNGNREKKKYEELKSQHIFYTYKVRLRKSNEEEKCFTWKWHSRWYKIGFNTVLKAAQVVSFWLKC